MIVTSVPTGPTAGANAVARGGCITVKSVALTAVPSTVVTPIFPVTAPSGTRNRKAVGVLDTIDPGGTPNVPIFTTGSPARAVDPGDVDHVASRHRTRRGEPVILAPP